MLIGELAHLSGLSRDTIRFYEKQRLIKEGQKVHRFNNYKEYPQATRQRLQLIQRLKGFGFTLKETAEFLELMDIHQASCHRVADKVAEKVAGIDQKIAELAQVKQVLLHVVDVCLHTFAPANGEVNCPMLTSDAFPLDPAQLRGA